MEITSMAMLRGAARQIPKAKPLAAALVAEAVRQGATLGEFRLAAELAVVAVEQAANPSLTLIKSVEGNTYAALKGI